MSDDYNSTQSDDIERERANARAQIAGLVADAERLLELARRQSEELLDEARAKAAETNRELTTEAERTLNEARREAESLRAAADRDREHAGMILSEAPERAATSQEGRTADEVLRIAQAEAEARSRELLEQTHRKVEAAEAEGRRRLEAMRTAYRNMQQRIRQEEFSAKARILALREETEELETRIASAKAQLGGRAQQSVVSHSGKAETPLPLAVDDLHRRTTQSSPDTPDGEPTASETLDRFTATASDPERALRGIRRRA